MREEGRIKERGMNGERVGGRVKGKEGREGWMKKERKKKRKGEGKKERK